MSSLRRSVHCSEGITEENHWIQHLLDAVSIRTSLPGRIRFHLGFEGDEVLSDTLRRELQKLDSVRLDTYSVRTRNALVTYDLRRVSEIDVVAALLKGVKEFARLHGECNLEHHHHENSRSTRSKNHHHSPEEPCDHEGHSHADDEEDCDHDHSATSTDAGIRKELLKLAATGCVLGYFVYKKVKGRPIAFAGNPLLDLASLVTIASGYSIFRAGVNSVQKNGKPTDDTLISIAVIATLLMRESITGLSVVWLINLGRLLEAITLKRSRTAIKELMDISPAEAWKIAGDEVKRVPVEEIQKKEKIRVFQGEKVPLDGRILRGQVLVKEAFITGESIPREKSVDDSVYAGSLIEQGEIDVEVTNLVHDTVVARMIDAIENARDKKAPIEKIGTRFASQFVPISIGVAVITLILTRDLRRAITMLVIACPCAAGLATPTAVSASIGQAARKGILIKGGTHIEAAAKIDTVVFDKTGTLTVGEPILTRFIQNRGCADAAGENEHSWGEMHCLLVAASAEQHTTHPLGLALVKEARKRGIELVPVTTHQVHPGLGIFATVQGRAVHVGNRRFMGSAGVTVPQSIESEASEGFSAGESILFFAVDGMLRGAFLVQDELRVEAHEMLSRLRSLGIKRVLLATGDQRNAAAQIGRRLGIQEVHAELLPVDKLDLVRRLKAEGCKVAVVGDGINDAQALTEADLSIAMGGGHCDIAIEAADVTLARNDLLLVAETLEISQKTFRTIYQNFAAAVGINAGGLVVSTFGKLSPFSAAIVHNASTIVVVLNSLRLGRQVAGMSPLQTLKEVRI